MSCIGQVWSKQYGLPSIIYAHVVHISSFAISQYKCFDAPRIQLSLQILSIAYSTLEGSHQFIHCCLLTWSKKGLEDWTKEVNKWLYFVTFEGAGDVTHV